MTHSVWPWFAEPAGFLTRFEVGLDGETAYERLKGNSAKVQGLSLSEGILWKTKMSRRPPWKLTCLLEDDVSCSVTATEEIRVVNQNGVWLTSTVQEGNCKGRMGEKQPGDDRGGFMAQERERRVAGWRTS